jgi:hypothetical protein
MWQPAAMAVGAAILLSSSVPSAAAFQGGECARAITQVREQPVASGIVPLFDFLVAQMLIVRDSGVQLEFDGWGATGRPPRCEVTFTYRADGAPVRLRWTADLTTGQVTAADDTTRQLSGLE